MGNKNKSDMKLPITKLGQNIQRVIAVTEEITKAGLIPICLIGFDSPDENKVIKTRFATLSNDKGMEMAVIEICRQLLISQGYAVTKTDTTTP